MRIRTLWLSSVVLTATLVAAEVLVAATRTAELPEGGAPTTVPSTPGPVAVLQEWDRRRAAAWADDDTAALRVLYVRGSSAGRHDLAMLAAYHRRGLRVTTMERQVLAVRVRRRTPRALSLVVTDRLAEARVTGQGETLALPRSRPATRRILLRRVATGWRVAEVYDD